MLHELRGAQAAHHQAASAMAGGAGGVGARGNHSEQQGVTDIAAWASKSIIYIHIKILFITIQILGSWYPYFKKSLYIYIYIILAAGSDLYILSFFKIIYIYILSFLNINYAWYRYAMSYYTRFQLVEQNK